MRLSQELKSTFGIELAAAMPHKSLLDIYDKRCEKRSRPVVINPEPTHLQATSTSSDLESVSREPCVPLPTAAVPPSAEVTSHAKQDGDLCSENAMLNSELGSVQPSVAEMQNQ